MSKLKDKLNYLDKSKIKNKWESIDSQGGLSTKEKLEKLVNLSLKRDKLKEKEVSRHIPASAPAPLTSTREEKQNSIFTLREYTYPLTTIFGNFDLSGWTRVSPQQLAVIFGNEEGETIDPQRLLFFDTETTGLAGGTGTIPFMLGFGFFEEDCFRVCIFVLNDLYQEGAFLEEVDRFLARHDFSGTVTYNGKSFDFPLMETRYILQRKRFPLLRLPHLDFLFPARTLWKHTCDSRKLGYLGDVLLGLSRADDVDPSQIPLLYFNYLRSRSFSLLEGVVQHNALDMLGLAALVLLAVKIQEDIAFTRDEGEILGTARLFEKYGDLEKARQLYELLQRSGQREDILAKAVKNLAAIKKRKKLYQEALDLWQLLSTLDSGDRLTMWELSVHFEHREKDYAKALEYVEKALGTIELTEAQRQDFEKRLQRLTKKIAVLDKEE